MRGRVIGWTKSSLCSRGGKVWPFQQCGETYQPGAETHQPCMEEPLLGFTTKRAIGTGKRHVPVCQRLKHNGHPPGTPLRCQLTNCGMGHRRSLRSDLPRFPQITDVKNQPPQPSAYMPNNNSALWSSYSLFSPPSKRCSSKLEVVTPHQRYWRYKPVLFSFWFIQRQPGAEILLNNIC